MTREPFSIHPTLQAHIDPLTEEEFRLLEESILAEGVRDPLVVWREENVLVDGHHRKQICDKHGLPYSVTYLSFPDIEAAKAWMDLNQLGRRNLTKEKRDEMIRRLAARGVKQKDIAEKVGMTEARISQIAKGKNLNNLSESTINTTTPSAEIASLQRKLEEAEAARRSTEQRLSAVQSDLKLAKMALDVTPEVVERDKDFLRSKLKEEQERHDAERKELIAELNAAKAKVKQAVPEVVEKVVEKPVVREVVREVVPESVQARLKDLEAQVRKTNANEQYLRNLDDRKIKLQNEIAALKEQATKDRVTANIEDAISFCQKERFVSTQVIEMAERGELTLEQIDMLLSVVGEISMESTKILNILQGLKSNFKKGGALRAL